MNPIQSVLGFIKIEHELVRIDALDWTGINRIKSDWFLTDLYRTRFKTFLGLVRNDAEDKRTGSRSIKIGWKSIRFKPTQSVASIWIHPNDSDLADLSGSLWNQNSVWINLNLDWCPGLKQNKWVFVGLLFQGLKRFWDWFGVTRNKNVLDLFWCKLVKNYLDSIRFILLQSEI